MPDNQYFALGMVHDQVFQTLHDELVGEDHVTEFVLVHRKVLIEKIGRLAGGFDYRLVPTTIFEIAWYGDD